VDGGRGGEGLEFDEVLGVRRGGADEVNGLAGGGVVLVGGLAGGALGVPEGGEPGARAVHEEREAGRGGPVRVVGLGDGAPAVPGDDRSGPGELLDGVQVAAAIEGGRVAEQVAGDDLVGEERVEQRRDAFRIGMVQERLEARAADQDVAPVGVREREYGAAVADGAAVLADGFAEQPEPARQLDARNGVRNRRGHAERIDVVARGQRPARGARRPDEDRDPLEEVAVAQDLRARLDVPFEGAVDAGPAGAFEESLGVADERRDVVDGNQVARAGGRRVLGLHGHSPIGRSGGAPDRRGGRVAVNGRRVSAAP